MLSDEQISLMLWLNEQERPVSKQQMDEMSAPGYTSQRIEEMRKAKLLNRDIDYQRDQLVGVYSVSDQGNALLSERKHMCNKEAEDKAQRRFQNQVSVAQVLVPLVAFILGLFADHYAGIVDLFFSLLG